MKMKVIQSKALRIQGILHYITVRIRYLFRLLWMVQRITDDYIALQFPDQALSRFSLLG